jgi:1-acyl-sn-glycerol-3-phosphate acyltransferase
MNDSLNTDWDRSLRPWRPVRRVPALEVQRRSHAVFECFTRMVCKVWCPIQVAGRDNLPNVPFLVCANHASHLDSIALMIACGQPFARFAILAAEDYFFGSRMRRVGLKYLLNLIPIERAASPSSVHQVLAACVEFLKPGNRNLILFPEGTRSANGEIGTFKPAAALFPLRLGLPIVPVYIGGTGHVLAKGTFFPKRAPIEVRIGKPLTPQGDDCSMEDARNRILAMREGPW